MNYWTIMRIPSEVLEGSEQHELLTVGGTHKVPFPTPTIFMGKAYVFCDYLPDAAEALLIKDIVIDLPEDSTAAQVEAERIKQLKAKAAQIEAYLDNNDTRCVWLSQGLAGALYKLLVPPEVGSP